ncbi:MAG: hypothetical protein H6Q89_3160 [Myxococcaceae bacterium]|nr:hypothetical protein [Myxococcaceae bacterium]
MRSLLLAAILVSSLAYAATDVSHAAVVVVRGSADHMDQVLARAKISFVAVSADELPSLALNAKQVLMVNCTGDMSAEARERVRRFVSAGGFLYTTDHAVRQLLEPIFPNTIAWTGTSTTERIVPVKVSGTEADRGLLNSLGGNAKELWQTASGGYPFKVLDPKRVTVLMESPEAAKLFGSGNIAARFRYEDGQVIHVTGHFFSQPGQQSDAVARAGQGFETFSANVVQEKKNDGARIDTLYGAGTTRQVQLQAGPSAAAAPAKTMGQGGGSVAKGEKLKVLEKSGEFVRVRDQQGNEGYVPADAL